MQDVPSNSADRHYAFHPDTGQRYVRQWVVETTDGHGIVMFRRSGSLEFCSTEAVKRPGAVIWEVLPPDGNYVQDPEVLCWTFAG